MKRIFSKLSLLFLGPVFLFSCQAPTSPGGTRKKMPELTSDNALEGPMPFQPATASSDRDAFAAQTSSIDLEVGGSMQGFVYVPLPDASNDSAAISLLHSFRLMA